VVDDVREGPLDAPISPTEYFTLNQTHDHSFSLVVRTSQDRRPCCLSCKHTPPDRSQSRRLRRGRNGGRDLLNTGSAAPSIFGLPRRRICCDGFGSRRGRPLWRHCYSVSQRTREIGIRMASGRSAAQSTRSSCGRRMVDGRRSRHRLVCSWHLALNPQAALRRTGLGCCDVGWCGIALGIRVSCG